MLTAPIGVAYEDVRSAVRKYVAVKFSGWGQTKVCEDAFKNLREQESMDTLTGVKGVVSYYANLFNMGAVTLHDRTEIEAPMDAPQAEGKASDVFAAKNHVPSLGDCSDIARNATWPRCSAQSSKRCYADIVMLRYLKANDCFPASSRCWQCELFQPSSVIYHIPTETYYLVLGQLCFQILICWLVEPVSANGTNFKAFVLGGNNVVNT